MATTDTATAITEILIANLESQSIPRARAVELVAKDPGTIVELITAQVNEAQTTLLQASLTPDS